MPNRPTHLVLGAGSGALCVLDLLNKVPSHGQFALLLGATLGGSCGGVLPDVLEPAEHPHHRSVCHSGTALVTLGWYWHKNAPAQIEQLLQVAADLREQRLQLPADDPARTWLALKEQGCYFTIGGLRGMLAGYASHLIADAVTPRGVPLVARTIV